MHQYSSYVKIKRELMSTMEYTSEIFQIHAVINVIFMHG